MRIVTTLLAVALLAGPLARPAMAADFEVSPLGDKGNRLGCMAMNTTTGVTFVAVAQNLSVMLTTKSFRVAKGDPVDGTWSVDGGKERALAVKADADGTVSADMDATKAALQMLGDGNELTATVGKSTMVFDLTGSKQALADLGDCMDKNVSK